MINCSCLCGHIKFKVEVIPEMTFNCHCHRCKKSHGSAFSTQILCNKRSLEFTQGKEYLNEYESSLVIRSFCSICGSRLMNYDKASGKYLSVAVSCIDTPNNFSPKGECFVDQKLDFIKLNESILHFNQLPELDIF